MIHFRTEISQFRLVPQYDSDSMDEPRADRTGSSVRFFASAAEFGETGPSAEPQSSQSEKRWVARRKVVATQQQTNTNN